MANTIKLIKKNNKVDNKVYNNLTINFAVEFPDALKISIIMCNFQHKNHIYFANVLTFYHFYRIISMENADNINKYDR